jgi:HEPN domain-containing protein
MIEKWREWTMNENSCDYWIGLAEYDLKTAEAMLKTGRYLYVGFMCHQVAEKALKAAIAKEGNFPPKIHNLTRLSELANLSNLLNKDQNLLLDKLFPLNIEARYPSHNDKISQELNKKSCKDYISKTEEFLTWIKATLWPSLGNTPEKL